VNVKEPSERCKEIFAILSEYLDKELPPDSCRELESHLEGCPPCIDFLESLRKSIKLCRECSPTELPKPLSKDARRQLQAVYNRMLLARESS
jgi:RNA polymerase sigma-70 factor (ECF subfamily)